MKNKEIEELLNKFKNADSQQFNELVEDFDNVYKLLSYIEQLEKENEKANKYIDFYEDLTEKQNKSLEEFKQENKQLKKQKDDVVKYIKEQIPCIHDEEILDDLLRMLGEIDG